MRTVIAGREKGRSCFEASHFFSFFFGVCVFVKAEYLIFPTEYWRMVRVCVRKCLLMCVCVVGEEKVCLRKQIIES